MTRRRIGSLFLSLVTVAGVLVAVDAAPAAAGFTTFSDPAGQIELPLGMDEAPDGSLWFASYIGNRVGQVDPATGAITTYDCACVEGPTQLSVAPDGIVWFSSTDNGRLGKVDNGVMSTIDVGMEGIDDVEVAADGDIWFNGFPSTGVERIGRYVPSTNEVFFYEVPGRFVLRMTPHPTDGMWFIWVPMGGATPRIRHITEAGTMTGFPTTGVDDPADVTIGPDGRLWFTAEDDDLIGRMNPTTGAVSTFSHPQVVVPNEIISGPDGDLWFAIRSGGRLGRIDPATGAIVTYQDPTDTVEGPIGLAVGGDGNLWYTRVTPTGEGLVGRFTLGTCLGQPVTVDLRLGSRPTAGDDVIVGTAAGNTIFAGRGNDVVCALNGNDKAYGGPGRDRIDLGPGDDTGDGQDGNDQVWGDLGADVVRLGSGADRGFGEGDGDIVTGDDGNDVVDGGPGGDALAGGNGTDTCHGGLGRDRASTCETLTGVP